MFYRKYSKKLKRKQHPDDVKGFKISTGTKQYSPFEMKDTRYLEHLREHQKLREAYEGSILKRKRTTRKATNEKIINTKLDRLMNEFTSS